VSLGLIEKLLGAFFFLPHNTATNHLNIMRQKASSAVADNSVNQPLTTGYIHQDAFIPPHHEGRGGMRMIFVHKYCVFDRFDILHALKDVDPCYVHAVA